MPGQDVLKFSVKEAQDYAIEHSFEVQNALYELQVAERQVKENLAQGLPQIDGSVDYTYYLYLPTSLIPGDFFGLPGELIEVQFGTEHNTTLGLSLNQLIFDGRYFIGLQYAKTFKHLTEEQVVHSEIEVQSIVTQAYYNILVLEESLKVLDSTRRMLERTRFETGELYKEGFVEETDYDQLTITLTDIENSYNNIRRQVEISYDMLRFQLALPNEQEILLTDDLEAVLLSLNMDAIVNQSFAIGKNIEYRILNSQKEMWALSLRNEKAYYWPNINGFFHHSHIAQRNEFSFFQKDKTWFPTTSVGVSMKIPLWSSGIRKARVDQAKIKLEKADNMIKQLEKSLQLKVKQARANFKTAVENYYREEQNVMLARKIYDKTMIKYREGVATSLELTLQHNQFFDAETKYFQTVLKLLNARIELDETLGNFE